MGWMEKLYQTYEDCKGGEATLPPIAHTVQQAHIEITLDGNGQFSAAKVLEKEATIIPATEDSANRTSGAAPHPLADKIMYCAADYRDQGGEKDSYFNLYRAQLEAWTRSSHSHPKARAVLAYVTQGHLVADLIRVGVMPVQDGKLALDWPSPQDMPRLLRQLTPKKDRERDTQIRDQGDALVRWRVEVPDAKDSTTWEDRTLMDAWTAYYESTQSRLGLCMIRGGDMPLAEKHPARLRNGGDKAKLISSNDKSGFTFRGRFLDAGQATTVSFEVTQKAHNALRWLIERQGTRIGDQVVVAWASGGKKVPDPCADSFDLSFLEEETRTLGDIGQHDSLALGRAATGFSATVEPTDDVMVMVLDAATPGRMSISYYRELKGSEFLARIEDWHRKVSWWQCVGTRENNGRQAPRRFVGAPSPRAIAEAVHGRSADDRLIQATVLRLLPCIIDGQPLPRDLGRAAFHRTCRRVGLRSSKTWEWEFEKVLGIACALYRGSHQTETYEMALEEDRTSRDYLFGRLLAVADHLESKALALAEEKRGTNAARYMQHFANRPASTWKTISEALAPYRNRLRARKRGLLIILERLEDSIMTKFVKPEDFIAETPLGPEFLLGYHCQRHSLENRNPGTEDNTNTPDTP
ncbi:type I-C CRISPR-associated protein Cas8c/Csd1 [Magnetospirillum sp. SS-4]|uniref:type I-C CRISPR-associated protein Cas8c/Csd1 n=1 Tax=Magnetospirillum sp. SS-4 TaxID=2681465 RepID=UPI001383C3F0|nr:type I-C CRISPR-associated protein Cas8c/Csd1 [Magnetospirillum sp. SS-4]CAA7616884.1 CRISPR-associated protein, Csd1 family [Magnetospirillum sp. SS-4]